MNYNFLIASERSGSNLITKLIDNHSYYNAPSPPHLLRAFHDKISSYDDLENDDNWKKIVTDFFEMFNNKIATWNTQSEFDELYNINDRQFINLFKYIYQKEAKSANKKNVFVKEVKTYNIFDFINEAFPNSKFIFLVRDPRDMALSWKKSPVHRGDLVRASKIWQEDQEKSLQLIKKYKDRILIVTYEDLISKQETELIKICTFLDIAFEKKMLDFHKNKLSIENSSQTDNWKNLNKSILSNNSKNYIKDLTVNEIRYIEYVCSSEMKKLAYTMDYPILSISEFNKIEKELLEIERETKPEYDLVPEEEKLKRQKWMSKFKSIKDLPK